MVRLELEQRERRSGRDVFDREPAVALLPALGSRGAQRRSRTDARRRTRGRRLRRRCCRGAPNGSPSARRAADRSRSPRLLAAWGPESDPSPWPSPVWCGSRGHPWTPAAGGAHTVPASCARSCSSIRPTNASPRATASSATSPTARRRSACCTSPRWCAQHGFAPEIVESDVLGLDEQAVDRAHRRARTALRRHHALHRGRLVGVAHRARRTQGAARDDGDRRRPAHLVDGTRDAGALRRVRPRGGRARASGRSSSCSRRSRAGGDLAGISGLLWREGDALRENLSPSDSARISTTCPCPPGTCCRTSRSAYPPAIYDYPRGPVATIAASRGCPFHCKFCDTSTFGARVRAYSPPAWSR